MATETYTREELMALANYLLSQPKPDSGPEQHDDILPGKSYPFGGKTTSHVGDTNPVRDPKTGKQLRSGPHTGQDIVGITTAQSADNGVVIYVGPVGGFGNTVVVRHTDGSSSHYSHLAKATVKVGDTVTYGEQLGVVGSTGNSSGPHLHYEYNPPGAGIGYLNGRSAYAIPDDSEEMARQGLQNDFNKGKPEGWDTYRGSDGVTYAKGPDGELYNPRSQKLRMREPDLTLALPSVPPGYTMQRGQDGEIYWVDVSGNWYNPSTQMYQTKTGDWQKVPLDSLRQQKPAGVPDDQWNAWLGKPGELPSDMQWVDAPHNSPLVGEGKIAGWLEKLAGGTAGAAVPNDATAGGMIRQKGGQTKDDPGKFGEGGRSGGELPANLDVFMKNPDNRLSLTSLINGEGQPQSFSDYRPADQMYFLPWADSELGGDFRAARNTMRGMGFNPDSGNPYTKFLEDRAVDSGKIASILQLMNGDETNLEGGISDRVAESIRSGQHLDTSQIGSFINDLANRAASGDTSLTPSQKTFLEAANDKGSAIPFAESIMKSSVNPYTRKYLRSVLMRDYDRFLNQAPADPNAATSFLGFLLGR